MSSEYTVFYFTFRKLLPFIDKIFLYSQDYESHQQLSVPSDHPKQHWSFSSSSESNNNNNGSSARSICGSLQQMVSCSPSKKKRKFQTDYFEKEQVCNSIIIFF